MRDSEIGPFVAGDATAMRGRKGKYIHRRANSLVLPFHNYPYRMSSNASSFQDFGLIAVNRARRNVQSISTAYSGAAC